MGISRLLLLFSLSVTPLLAQVPAEGPTSQKAQKSFTIDADGVLQDQHIGDASIEGKLKKLVARARELQAPQKTLQ
jgi:hypothetical protein